MATLAHRVGHETGPAFRSVDRHGRLGSKRLSDRAVADMVKRRALAVGLDGAFAGHSLRAGFATEGYAQGTPELAIMRHGRWRSAAVMRGYVEDGALVIDETWAVEGVERAVVAYRRRLAAAVLAVATRQEPGDVAAYSRTGYSSPVEDVGRWVASGPITRTTTTIAN